MANPLIRIAGIDVMIGRAGDDMTDLTGFGPGFDFSDVQLTTVNGNDVLVTATGYTGSILLQDAIGRVTSSDFSFSPDFD